MPNAAQLVLFQLLIFNLDYYIIGMTKSVSILLSTLLLAGATLIPLTVDAQSTSGSAAVSPFEKEGWKKVFVTIVFTGSAVSLDELGKPNQIEVVYSGTSETRGNVQFNCFNGRPSVSFALEPVDMREMLTNPPDSRRRKLKRPKISIDGTRIDGEDWIYMPAMEVYRARRMASLKSLYNATVMGSAVEVRTRGNTELLNLPTADDAFKDFGAKCGLGRLAER